MTSQEVVRIEMLLRGATMVKSIIRTIEGEFVKVITGILVAITLVSADMPDFFGEPLPLLDRKSASGYRTFSLWS